MEEKKTIRFTKMHGAGNDYIYVDAARYPIGNPAEAARLWSRSHTGIGSDGLILVMPSSKADFRMRMFNADGSEGDMCGNASRCFALWQALHRPDGLSLLPLEAEYKYIHRPQHRENKQEGKEDGDQFIWCIHSKRHQQTVGQ